MNMTIYIFNKYNTLYHSIINNALSQKRHKGNVYYESHHIEPKSFGGSNSKENRVLLTAREHYLCHYLLTKFTVGKYKTKMIYAFDFMNINQNHKINSKLFESNKLLKSHIMKNNTHSLGYKHSKETKNKMSAFQSGKILSTNHKQKISTSHKGKLNPKFKGFYITPWGKFESSKLAETNLLSKSSIKKWCIYKLDRVISHQSIRQSPYLQHLKDSPLGKTFKDIGFDFMPQ